MHALSMQFDKPNQLVYLLLTKREVPNLALLFNVLSLSDLLKKNTVRVEHTVVVCVVLG